MKKLLLITLTCLISTVTFAELKPQGTVISQFCGDTQTIPVATQICVASTVGSDSVYVILNIHDEVSYPSQRNNIYVKATVERKALMVHPSIYQSVYSGTYVRMVNGYMVEQKIKFTLNNTQGKYDHTGTLVLNGQIYYGSENIKMHVISHTL